MDASAQFEHDLAGLLAPLPHEIGILSRRLVQGIGSMPGLSAAVRMGWRSVNFRHVAAGHVCSLFPHDDRVALYFEHGRLLEDPEGLLQGGNLKKGRFLRLVPGAALPEAGIALLIAETIAVRA